MEGRRWLWRMWIAVSACWFIAVVVTIAMYPKTVDLYPAPDGGATNEPWKITWQPEDRLRCSAARKNNADLGDPMGCFSPDIPDRKVFDAAKNAALLLDTGILPPALLLLAGAATLWFMARYQARAR